MRGRLPFCCGRSSWLAWDCPAVLRNVDLLVLGGTAWLGREVADAAVARGHAVTCLARGEAGQFAQGCRRVIADRERPDAYTAVLDEFGTERALVARAGLIGGPGDTFGRSGYWPWRFAHPSNPNRAVLVPDDPLVPTGLIDVRDLAVWLVTCAEAGMTGVYNAAGESRPLSDHLAVARAVAGHTGPVVAAPPLWLVEHGVQMWMGPKSLPLWIDDPDWYGLNARSSHRAPAAGLSTRSLEDTLVDTLAWEEGHPDRVPHGAGLTDDEEDQLLELLSQSAQ